MPIPSASALATPAFGGAGIMLLLVWLIRQLPAIRKAEIEGAAGRRKDKADRITELEQRMDAKDKECDAQIEGLRQIIESQGRKIIMIAQSTMEVIIIAERHEPDSPVLARARSKMELAFSMEELRRPSPPDPVLASLVQQVERKPA